MDDEEERVDGRDLFKLLEPGSDALLSDEALEKIYTAIAREQQEDDARRSQEERQ